MDEAEESRRQDDKECAAEDASDPGAEEARLNSFARDEVLCFCLYGVMHANC